MSQFQMTLSHFVMNRGNTRIDRHCLNNEVVRSMKRFSIVLVRNSLGLCRTRLVFDKHRHIQSTPSISNPFVCVLSDDFDWEALFRYIPFAKFAPKSRFSLRSNCSDLFSIWDNLHKHRELDWPRRDKFSIWTNDVSFVLLDLYRFRSHWTNHRDEFLLDSDRSSLSMKWLRPREEEERGSLYWFDATTNDTRQKRAEKDECCPLQWTGRFAKVLSRFIMRKM